MRRFRAGRVIPAPIRPKGQSSDGGATALSEAMVREIRARVGTHKELAEIYGISAAQIQKIRARAKWKHVA